MLTMLTHYTREKILVAAVQQQVPGKDVGRDAAEGSH